MNKRIRHKKLKKVLKDKVDLLEINLGKTYRRVYDTIGYIGFKTKCNFSFKINPSICCSVETYDSAPYLNYLVYNDDLGRWEVMVSLCELLDKVQGK